MDVTLQPEIEKMVLDQGAKRGIFKQEHGMAQGPGRPDLRSLELAQDRNGMDVFQSARSQGIDPPLMHRIVPEDSVSWGGW